mmetsp:Transcript_53870/g.122791  ORF Transcript_53870/g.122791 Transcript_53870/m.122791 type:complete len:528 (+) Transcript_53870:62-1645(+)
MGSSRPGAILSLVSVLAVASGSSSLGPVVKSARRSQQQHSDRGSSSHAAPKRTLKKGLDPPVEPLAADQVEAEPPLYVAHCLVGAPRGLVAAHGAPGGFFVQGLVENLRTRTLLGLAGASHDAGRLNGGTGTAVGHFPSTVLKLFVIMHNHDANRYGKARKQFKDEDVRLTLDSLVKGGRDAATIPPGVSLSIAQTWTTDAMDCTAREARSRLPCCDPRRHAKNGARGMLINLWPDECFQKVEDYEARHGVRFAWVVKSRPDLACARPLPSLRSLPPDRVYSTIKERGEMWDPLFLIPRPLLRAFRNQSMFVALNPGKLDCANSGRQKVPEVPLFADLVHGVKGGPEKGVPLQRLPLPCALARPPNAGLNAAQETARECTKRLASHAHCADRPWPDGNTTACPPAPEAAAMASLAAARAVCADLAVQIFSPGGGQSPEAGSSGKLGEQKPSLLRGVGASSAKKRYRGGGGDTETGGLDVTHGGLGGGSDGGSGGGGWLSKPDSLDDADSLGALYLHERTGRFLEQLV